MIYSHLSEIVIPAKASETAVFPISFLWVSDNSVVEEGTDKGLKRAP
jgi:hypothetical protein